MIEVTGLRFGYPGAPADSIRDVSLTIDTGDFVAVVGGNGSGKTTLCKAINGLIPHYWAGDFAGRVLLDGTDTTDVSVAQLAHKVGYVYQDFGNQLVRATVQDEVSFGPVNFGLDDHRERTEDALTTLGIAHLRSQFVWQLSGGQQHLVAIASVLAMRPDIIIVDEPVAELDPLHAERVYERLDAINRERGTTIIVIEHHAEFIARYCRSVILMADGELQWHQPVREALSRAEELAQHGIPAPQIAQALRSIDPAAAVPLTVAEAAESIRALGWSAADRSASITPAGVEPPESRAVVARARNVRFGYSTVSGGRTATLDGLSLDLHDGDRVALVGGNGAGKSTLMKLLTGLKVPLEGEVEIDGINTRTESPALMANRVSYLHQRPEQMFLSDTIRADISMFPSQRKRADWQSLVDEILERMNLIQVADRDGRMLSGGQQRRATLGIGLAMTPSLLLLDEPTSSLDLATRDAVTALLGDLSERIRCVVVATHDMHLVAEWADRVIVLGSGRVLRDTTPALLFDDVELMAEAQLVPPQITQLGTTLGMSPPPLTVAELRQRLAPEAAPRSSRVVAS
jgi:energy-coupling factor transport system ATP-binding protein